MADIAQSAVLVSSGAAGAALAGLPEVRGPESLQAPLTELLGGGLGGLGFQASHLAQACALARRMLTLRPRSATFVIEEGQFVRVETDAEREEGGAALHFPRLFLGLTANLLGTGCREAARFMVREGWRARGEPGGGAAAPADDGVPVSEESDYDHFLRLAAPFAPRAAGLPETPEPPPAMHSFVSAVVVSGGGVEHDLRRACGDYMCGEYASAAAGGAAGGGGDARFGNVSYAADPPLFRALMRRLLAALLARQAALEEGAQQGAALGARCAWRVAPSEVWALAGAWLKPLMLLALRDVRGPAEGDAAEACRRAETAVVYWAARQRVPVFCPSFADGDVMRYVLEAAGGPGGLLALDLVADIHALNKLAMLSPCTAAVVCGGGAVKHHICNANLMRNGADMAVFINNGQEFDGSDGGARPEEAVSWGKIRIDGEAVKVYAEVTSVLPLLVTQVFVPAAREAHAALAAQQ